MGEERSRCGGCGRSTEADPVGRHDLADEGHRVVCGECVELSLIETEAYLRALGLLDLP